MTAEEIDEIARLSSKFAQMAHERGAGALVFHPYDGPPPEPGFFLDMMREMIDFSGEALGCITVGCGDEGTGTLPLIDVHPVDALHAILHVRLGGIIPSVNWVTLCCDTYEFETDDPDAQRGTATEAFKRGDPNATEALMAICVAPDGPGYNVSLPYVRTTDGVEWGEPRKAIANLGEVAALMQRPGAGVTPFLLLLTSAEEVGGPVLIPVNNIAYAGPVGETVRIFLKDRDAFIDVTERWDSIIAILGGLVMKPHRGPVSVPR